jgi:hypothetical protein
MLTIALMDDSILNFFLSFLAIEMFGLQMHYTDGYRVTINLA